MWLLYFGADTDSHYKPVVKTLPPAISTLGTVSRVQEQNPPILKSAVCADVKFEKVSVIKNSLPVKIKNRRPNTLLCFIKTGRKLLSARIRCRSYLKTARLQAVYKVRLSHMRLMRKTPWQVTAHKVRIQPVSNRAQHRNANAPANVHKKLSKVQPHNDIDDIFSALNV